MSLSEKDRKYVWHPFTQHFTIGEPLEIISAKGVYLYDSQGRSYIDANSSWWVNTHGHGHPHIGKAISQQFQEMDHIVFAGATHPKAVELASRIVALMPNNLEKVFFSDNGSTAVEIAMKMVIQYFYNQGKKRNKFIAINGSYHGDTFGAMSVGQRGYFNKPFESLFFDTTYIDFPEKDNEEYVLNQVKAFLEKENYAGLVVEPLVQGAAGMRMYSAYFLDELIKLSRQKGLKIIFDEVMTGFGRTGKMFAMDYCHEKPDLVALSKGLTAGVMALGLTVASNEIYEAFLSDDIGKALLHGHSFTANPIACAVACANLDLFEDKETWENIKRLSSWHQMFQKELTDYHFVEKVRQRGTILAFNIKQTEDSYFSDIKTRIYHFLLKKGVLLRPLGNVIFFNPPYSISKEEYNQVKTGIIEFLNQL